MAQADAQARAERVLRTVFAPPNRFSLSDEEGGEAVPEPLREAIAAFRSGQGSPMLLPWRELDSDPVTWLACAHDLSGSRALAAEMNAFVGPSYAVRAPEPGPRLPSGRPLSAWLEDQQLHATVFVSQSRQADARIASQWALYSGLNRIRPPRLATAPRTFAQLRAAFDMALAAGQRREAEQAVAAMRDSHSLTAENRAFLEIRIRAAFGRWKEIREHPRLRDLLSIRLPPETSADILEAFYEDFVRPKEANGSLAGLLSCFAGEVAATCGPLLRGRGGSRRTVVFKCLLLEALSAALPVPELCAELLAATGEDAFGAAGPEIRQRVGSLQPRRGMASAREAMQLERYEEALAVLQQEPDSLDVLIAALDCACRIGDPGIAEAVLARLAASAGQTGHAVRSQRPRLVGEVEALAARQPPQTLEEQLAIAADAPQEALDIVEHWREIVRGAESEAFAADPAFVTRLVSAMEDHVLDAPPIFDNLLPIWSEWLLDRLPPRSGLIAAYVALVDCLRTRDRLGESELELIRLACEHLLRSGPDTAAYTQVITQIEGVLQERNDPPGIRWGVAVLDVLASGVCRDPDARLRIAAVVMDGAARHRARLDPASMRILEALCSELGIPAAERPAEDATPAGAMPRDPQARVLLYSLDRLAIDRAARMLTAMFPGSRFDVSDDVDCSGRLRGLARSADWIVFVSRVAKHQPFYCVDTHRGPSTELLYVSGSGTTRLVETVVERAGRPLGR